MRAEEPLALPPRVRGLLAAEVWPPQALMPPAAVQVAAVQAGCDAGTNIRPPWQRLQPLEAQSMQRSAHWSFSQAERTLAASAVLAAWVVWLAWPVWLAQPGLQPEPAVLAAELPVVAEPLSPQPASRQSSAAD
jgi:hypothetical protein